MQTFAEWLDERLTERGWNAADLTRASRTSDYPRGIDSGLISRWRRPAPLGVVPTQAHTLRRLAHAFGVQEIDVWRAAGLSPEGAADHASDTDEAALAADKFAGALRDVPRRFWSSVVEASVALANAYAEAPVGLDAQAPRTTAEGPVSDSPVPPVRNARGHANKGRKSDGADLAESYRPGFALLALR